MSKLLDMGLSYEEVRNRNNWMDSDPDDPDQGSTYVRKGNDNSDPDGYETRRGKSDGGKADDFDDFMDSYNLQSKGAGSQKDPQRSRLSAHDVGEMFEAGVDRFGESKSDVARAVLDYADDMEGKTRMGGGTEKALDRMRGYLKQDKDEKEPEAPAPPSPEEIKAEEFKNEKMNEIRERLAKPPINIYENYAGKDDLIARNKSQSQDSAAESSDDKERFYEKGIEQDFLNDYIFKAKNGGQFVGQCSHENPFYDWVFKQVG